EEPVVNYAKMTDPIHLLRKSSEGVGGCGVVLASFGLQYACRDKNKERCLEIFKVLKDEYHILVNNLHTLYQMEKTVLAEEEKAASEEEEEKAALEEEEESDLSDDSKGGL
ncbi:putative Histidine-containing phosphotransfer protein, partial [Quillaja saponaria]